MPWSQVKVIKRPDKFTLSGVIARARSLTNSPRAIGTVTCEASGLIADSTIFDVEAPHEMPFAVPSRLHRALLDNLPSVPIPKIA